MGVDGGQGQGGEGQSGASAGGASGAVAGGQSGQANQADDTAALSNLVNSAVTSQIKRVLPKVLEEALAPLRERLMTAPQAGEGDGQAKAPATLEAQKTGLTPQDARITRLEQELKAEREARKAERKSLREKDAMGDLRRELANRVRPEAVEQVATLIMRGYGLLNVPDEGPPVMVVDGEEFTIADGLDRYLKKPEAKLFLPAPGYEKDDGRSRVGAARRAAAVPQRSTNGAQQGGRSVTPEEKTIADFARLGIAKLGVGG